MWLKYGVDTKNSVLVSIEDATSGKTDLICLYCGSKLTAKKGKIKQHHFAHTEETCRPVAAKTVPDLPLYDAFNIQLSGKELEELKVFWKEYGRHSYSIPTVPFKFVLSKLLVWNNDYQSQGHEFTDLGKIPVCALPLELFNQVQEPLILDKLDSLEQAATRAKLTNSSSLPERLADLKMYRAQVQRILQFSLYFLEIKADGKLLHKIGVTRRSINERVLEVQRDLKSHYKDVFINVLGTWLHRGNVERYFKYRYQELNYPIGTLTEYFKFTNVDPVLEDLNQMAPKILTQAEIDILQDKLPKMKQIQ
ncbi:GIY-YIG nuclease family protein [Coleofasciculus sp. FACHB-501]|uniref:GIY-YIG nuclease family protein n=1 Tax=Cyanophyceae TaxID=3028117 RepID=UPI001685D768|nr:GIY-YIG nuclease family protein [Coleofasciculus sp. FACHB-501]MBD1836647.1 GIY-YIG nuclease family protein [Coleofasciculus sp. FACHB-501]